MVAIIIHGVAGGNQAYIVEWKGGLWRIGLDFLVAFKNFAF